MLRTERHGDVTRLELSTGVGRWLGYTVSAYQLGDLLIDTGFPHVAGELGAWVAARETTLAGAIVTHWHEDHSGGVVALAARGMPLAVPPETERRLRQPPRLELYRRITWGSFVPLTVATSAFVPNGVEIVATPGHSSDHRVVWDPSTGTLFAGDLFLGVKVRIAHDDEDFAALIVSLRRCAAFGPARLFCAHRGLVPNAAAALRAKADWLAEMVSVIGRRAEEGWSDARIVRDVMGGEELTGRVSKGHYSRATFVRVAKRVALSSEVGARRSL